MNTCAHCGSAPERREDAATGRVLFICPVCRHHAGASICEPHIVGKWNRANDPALPRCCDGQGVPRFFHRGEKWGTRCSVCSRENHGFMTIEAAVAGWLRTLRK
ncbi:MAG: hypothetical protein VX796_09290 [Pseudomonadota bacterium]|nr:hypothetical protein [Pseudomonadota bacterium]